MQEILQASLNSATVSLSAASSAKSTSDEREVTRDLPLTWTYGGKLRRVPEGFQLVTTMSLQTLYQLWHEAWSLRESDRSSISTDTMSIKTTESIFPQLKLSWLRSISSYSQVSSIKLIRQRCRIQSGIRFDGDIILGQWVRRQFEA